MRKRSYAGSDCGDRLGIEIIFLDEMKSFRFLQQYLEDLLSTLRFETASSVPPGGEEQNPHTSASRRLGNRAKMYGVWHCCGSGSSQTLRPHQFPGNVPCGIKLARVKG